MANTVPVILLTQCYIANTIEKQIDSREGKLATHAIANVALGTGKNEHAIIQASGVFKTLGCKAL
ncbi:MAG: hypothetical protein ACSLEL_04680 [Candidatus Malihini olakiniferum]